MLLKYSNQNSPINQQPQYSPIKKFFILFKSLFHSGFHLKSLSSFNVVEVCIFVIHLTWFNCYFFCFNIFVTPSPSLFVPLFFLRVCVFTQLHFGDIIQLLHLYKYLLADYLSSSNHFKVPFESHSSVSNFQGFISFSFVH